MLVLKNGIWQGKTGQIYVQSDMPDTSDVTTLLFCAATQLLGLRHLVWTAPHITVLYVGTICV